MEVLNHSVFDKPSFPRPIFLKPPFLHCSFKPTFLFDNSHMSSKYKRRDFSFIANCRLKIPQDNKKNNTKKIILSEGSPPPLVEEDGEATENEEVKANSGNRSGVMRLIKRLPRKILSVLSNLPLAIGEMFAVAALMAIGMLVFKYSILDVYTNILIWVLLGFC